MKKEELKDRIDVASEPMTCEIERGMLKRFVQAIGDDNPLWQDEVYAGKTKYGGTVVPPTFLIIIGNEQFHSYTSEIFASFPNNLNGGTELEFYQPVRPGDKLILTTKLTDVYERDIKVGRATFAIFETSFQNKKEGLTAIYRQTAIFY
ncbi:MaoC family dehydratase N-terminal domain-containing protein [Chloroflexota bacterium]